jgi:hypothetical protein
LVSSLRRLWLLPFANRQAGIDLLLFQHARMPGRKAAFVAEKNVRGARLCRMFELLMTLALQGNSVFPQNALHLARLAQQSIETGLDDSDRLAPLLDLLVNPDGQSPRAGNNPFALDDADLVVLSEYERASGIAEPDWKAEHKFKDYRARLLRNPDFGADWEQLKAGFPLERLRDSQGIIRRSALPERYWQPPTYPDLRTTREQFQVCFDVFCWKWFLYGMRQDEPLVDKLTITYTPFGTQIFVPGYWSLDATRDLDWGRILKLHRARGIPRQGLKLSTGRQERDQQLARLVEADAKARERGLRGAARYRFLKREAGLGESTDDRQVRRLLTAARRVAGKTSPARTGGTIV